MRLLIVVLAIGALAIGCKKSAPANDGSLANGTNSSPMSVTQQLENAKEIATNAWQKSKEATTNALENAAESMQFAMDYAYDKKDVFVADASADLDALDRKINELSDKASTASDAVKADAQAKVQGLRDQRATLDKKLDALKNATEANWNDAKTDFQKSYDDVKASCMKTWQWLKDKLSS